jgi:hypothetical protein
MTRINAHVFLDFSKNIIAEKQKTQEKKVENQDQCGWIGGQLEDLKNHIHRLHFPKKQSTSWGSSSVLPTRLLVLLGEKSHRPDLEVNTVKSCKIYEYFC